jgi:histidinol-phosphate aminotransferase
MKSLNALIRKNISNLQPYASARNEFQAREGITFLDANENPFGDGVVNRYPDPLQSDFRERWARFRRVTPEQIVFGNGSDELIDLIIRIFCEPKDDSILICPPTFGFYEVSARINNVGVISVPLDEGFDLDTEAVLEKSKNAKVLFLCSPNSPTGNVISKERVEKILNVFSGIVVMDEAYIDFADTQSWVASLPKFPRLIVLQTFSKFWGLAGARLGAAFADPEIIQLFQKIKPPYNINNLTIRAAVQQLESVYIEQQKSFFTKERKALEDFLCTCSFVEQVFPSQANFIFLKVKDGAVLYDFLLQKNIIIRKYSNLPNFVRISLGTAEHNQALKKALTLSTS